MSFSLSFARPVALPSFPYDSASPGEGRDCFAVYCWKKNHRTSKIPKFETVRIQMPLKWQQNAWAQTNCMRSSGTWDEMYKRESEGQTVRFWRSARHFVLKFFTTHSFILFCFFRSTTLTFSCFKIWNLSVLVHKQQKQQFFIGSGVFHLLVSFWYSFETQIWRLPRSSG